MDLLLPPSGGSELDPGAKHPGVRQFFRALYAWDMNGFLVFLSLAFERELAGDALDAKGNGNLYGYTTPMQGERHGTLDRAR